MSQIWTRKLSMVRLLAATGVCALVLARSSAAVEVKIDVVEASGAGKFSSLKVDRDGNVHVAYAIEDGNRYPLRYAYRDHTNGRWFTMDVAEGSGPCSLTLDSRQRPHISFVDYGTGSGSKLRYAYWDGAAWKKQVIPLNSDVIAYYNSIVLDAQDRPVISFYEYRGPRDTDLKIRLRTVMWSGSAWELRTVDPEEGSGKFNALAVDVQGRIHLAYANVSAGTASFRYAYWDGTEWKKELVDGLVQNNGEEVGYSTNIAVDKEGNPHVTYANTSNPMVKYAVRKNGHWQITAVDALASVGYPDRNSIGLDEKDRPYIGYYDPRRGQLKVAHLEGSRWEGNIIDTNGAGFTSSLQVDRGVLWISYADEAHGQLKVAHLEIQAPESNDAGLLPPCAPGAVTAAGCIPAPPVGTAVAGKTPGAAGDR